MKKLIVFVFVIIGLSAKAQDKKTIEKPQIIDVACGECQFKMKGKSCDLAVRINGKSYFVDGTSIDDHGDAHAAEGFCNAVCKAKVTGKIVKNRFVATSFELLPSKK